MWTKNAKRAIIIHSVVMWNDTHCIKEKDSIGREK